MKSNSIGLTKGKVSAYLVIPVVSVSLHLLPLYVYSLIIGMDYSVPLHQRPLFSRCFEPIYHQFFFYTLLLPRGMITFVLSSYFIAQPIILCKRIFSEKGLHKLNLVLLIILILIFFGISLVWNLGNLQLLDLMVMLLGNVILGFFCMIPNLVSNLAFSRFFGDMEITSKSRRSLITGYSLYLAFLILNVIF